MTLDLQDVKTPWVQWCNSVGMGQGEAFRALVARLETGCWPIGLETINRRPIRHNLSEGRSVRPKVPLSAAEWESVQKLADGEGMTVPRWIVSLVRAYLSGQPQLGADSVDVLRRSNLQLQALGRNVNQIARALNALVEHLEHGRLREADEVIRSQRGAELRPLIEEVKASIGHHLPIVSQVLTDNVERWRPQGRQGEK